MSSKRKISAPIKHPGDHINDMAATFGGNLQFDFYHSPLISISGTDKPSYRFGVSGIGVDAEEDAYLSSSPSSPAASGNAVVHDGGPPSPMTSGRWSTADNNNVEPDRVIPQAGKFGTKRKASDAQDVKNGIDGRRKEDEQGDDDVMESVRAAIGSAASVDDKQRLLSVMISQLQSLKENLVTQQLQPLGKNNGVSGFRM
jgi:hypothetical protein